MSVGINDIRRRHSEMIVAEFDLIKRGDLISDAQEVYDVEKRRRAVAIRGSLEPPQILPPAEGVERVVGWVFWAVARDAESVTSVA